MKHTLWQSPFHYVKYQYISYYKWVICSGETILPLYCVVIRLSAHVDPNSTEHFAAEIDASWIWYRLIGIHKHFWKEKQKRNRINSYLKCHIGLIQAQVSEYLVQVVFIYLWKVFEKENMCINVLLVQQNLIWDNNSMVNNHNLKKIKKIKKYLITMIWYPGPF